MTPKEKEAILALLHASQVLLDAERPRSALACLKLAVDETARRV